MVTDSRPPPPSPPSTSSPRSVSARSSPGSPRPPPGRRAAPRQGPPVEGAAAGHRHRPRPAGGAPAGRCQSSVVARLFRPRRPTPPAAIPSRSSPEPRASALSAPPRAPPLSRTRSHLTRSRGGRRVGPPQKPTLFCPHRSTAGQSLPVAMRVSASSLPVPPLRSTPRRPRPHSSPSPIPPSSVISAH